MKHTRSLLLASGLLFALSVPVSAQYAYEAIDLGNLGADSSSAYRINNHGQIAVTTFTGASWGAALWQPVAPNNKVGSLVSLGSLGGSFSSSAGINDRGQVTGVSEDGSGTRHAYVWSPSAPNTTSGSMVSIGLSNSAFPGINSYGQVALESGGRPGLWTPSTANGTSGSTITLPASYGSSAAINASGQFTGSYGAGTYHPFRFTPSSPNGTTGTTERIDQVPGSFILDTGSGTDINDSGTVVGNFLNGTAYNPFLWSGSTMVNLAPGAVGGSAEGINNAGDVVGHVSFVSNVDYAFLYQSGGALTNLNTLIDPSSGWILLRASDINDHGQIVGYGIHNGQARGFLLAPAAAPEPGTLGLLALGALSGIVARRWKGQKR